MNKIAKKLFGFVLAAAMMVTALGPATVQAGDAGPQVQESQTVYRLNSSSISTQRISVDNLTKSQTIKKSTVKSSNTKVAKLRYLQRNINDYSYKTEYFEDGMEDYEYGDKYYSYDIALNLLKAGKSTISFKIGKKSYKTTITVKNYTNPIDSMQITGISSGKNIAGKLKKQNNANMKLSKNVKNAAVTVKAKKGWNITSINVSYLKKVTSGTYSYYNTDEQYSYYAYGDGKSSVSMKVGTLKGKERYTVRVALKNSSNGATIDCYYYINNNQ